MKNLQPEQIQLIQAALNCRDSFRRLAAKIAAAGEDLQLRAEALEAERRRVAVVHCDLLKLALEDAGGRRHRQATSEAQPLLAVTRRPW